MKKLLLFSLFALLASAMGWAATETWVKVTSQDDLTDGEYLIVCESKSKAFDGSLKSITEKNTPIDIKISSNKISLDDKYCFTISKKGDAYSITSKSGSQIGTKTVRKVQTGSDLTNTIFVNSDKKVVITSVQVSDDKCTLQYNAKTPRFSYYTSNQEPIALYKKQEGQAPQQTQVASIKEFLDKADTENAMVFTNPVTVIGQYTTKQGTDLYVKDKTGSLLIYNPGITGLVNGDVIEAGFSGVYQLHNSLPELTKPENLVKSATAGTPVEPTVVTIDELALADYSEYVSLKKVKYDGSNFVDLKDETKKIAAYNNKFNLVTLTAGKVYNVTGIYSINIDKVEILPLTAEELQYVADVTVSPAFGDIAKGTVVTISCATEGAVLNGTVGKEELNGAALPYTYTASELGALKVEVYASKGGLEDSEVLTGTYNVCQPKVAALEIKPGFGTIEVGTEITISCATKGAVLNGTVGTVDLNGAALPYIFTASEVGEIEVGVWATNTKDGYKDSEPLSGTFIVKTAVPVAYRDVINPADLTNVSSYPSEPEKLTKGGASYLITAIVANKTANYIQLNNKSNAGIVMNVSNAAPSKIIIKWNGSHSNTLNIYGKNIPYTATSELYGSDKGNLIGTATYDAESTVVELDGTYTYIGLVSNKGVMTIRSIEFIWNEGAAGGADVTYTKASEAKAGNFAVLATADGKAVGRNADLTPVNVTVSGDAIGLAKGQTAIDEFEIKENGNNYQLYGGLASNGSRRYLTYDATGVTTVATADDNANVTFVSTAAGLLVKFKDGEYLMFNGNNFVKGEYTEVATQAEGKTLTPVIVFMSSSNVSTGVETVEFDENAEAQYFNLNGVQVKAENLTPGLYIVRQGNKVSKQVIR